MKKKLPTAKQVADRLIERIKTELPSDEIPPELDRIADRVLTYRPPAHNPKQRKRKRKAKKHENLRRK